MNTGRALFQLILCHNCTLELVLRNSSGRFAPTPYLMGVLCHEVSASSVHRTLWLEQPWPTSYTVSTYQGWHLTFLPEHNTYHLPSFSIKTMALDSKHYGLNSDSKSENCRGRAITGMVSKASLTRCRCTPETDGRFCAGYWSSGTRLADSTRVAGEGIEDGHLPEYLVSSQLGDRVSNVNGIVASANIQPSPVRWRPIPS